MPGLKPKKPQPAVAEQPAPAIDQPKPTETPAAAVAEQPAEFSPAHSAASAGNGSHPAENPGSDSYSPEDELQLRENPRVEQDIREFKEAHPREVEYFKTLVYKHPERAINFHFHQKQKMHVADTRAAMRQMLQAHAIYDKMSPESRQRIDERMANVNRYSHTKRFVASVFSELNRQSMADNRRKMTAPITKADLGAARPDMGGPTPDAPSVAAPPPAPSAPSTRMSVA
jgi:hypothetical protein